MTMNPLRHYLLPSDSNERHQSFAFHILLLSILLKFKLTYRFRSFVFYLQGICPGNRLKVIPAFETGCYTPSPAPSPCPSTPSMYYNSSILSNESMYENTVGMNGRQSLPQLQPQQKHGKRRSWHIMPNKVSKMRMRSDRDLFLAAPNFIFRQKTSGCRRSIALRAFLW